MRSRLLRLQLLPLLCATVVLFQACESMKKCFACTHKPISLAQKICTLIWGAWHCRGNASAPVGTHVFQAVTQACLFSQQCGSAAHRFLVFSSVGAARPAEHSHREGGTVGSVGKRGGDRGAGGGGWERF